MTPSQSSDTTPSSRLVALAELTVFVAIALISKQVLDEIIWRYAGPISLVGTLILLTVYMKLRGQSWRTTGLPALPGRRAKLMLAPKTLLAFGAFALAVGGTMLGAEVLNLDFMDEMPPGVEDRWGGMEGNLPLFLLWLGIVWTSAAFGEEMFFRGFVITRLIDVLAGARSNPFLVGLIAVVVAAALFGYGHYYYQGLRGLIMTGAIGLAFGTMFLVYKRNLWPLIILHGLVDTIGFTARYLGLE